MESKEITREEIERQTAEYLAKGREIEEVPAKEVTPEHIEWMRRRGIDFTPWWS